MSTTTTFIIESMAILGGLGLAVGLMLIFASKKFKVETNPLVEEIITILPGANCGACGYAGCADFADRVVNENAPITGCPVGGFEVAKGIGGILGQDVSESEKQYPFIRCHGGLNCTDRFEYVGFEDCKAVMMLSDGEKGCSYGCMGRGTCVRACPFDALTIGEDRLPHVNRNLCTSCGLCISSCPNDVLVFAKESEKVHVRCVSHDKGKTVKEVCTVGCIGCKICEKNCPEQAITVTNFLAVIDQDKCTGCGICVEKCPQNTIEIR
ncbi:Rnf electron transport complex subunit RnfB [Methanolobus chelungpuianus]|uniref:Ion-translocating oxidoreductase complex subunit B n=1 Tax=Methanolobus chelungpuianus TaxID=502115 RepID=A0AAE3KX87_9EURY|nr:Rnf electron transport complex subunit RnfB [Methanolobus chelungpuianus]MCQ6961984.1 electron transporter RnfB [Methanolobus chelungpuianus]